MLRHMTPFARISRYLPWLAAVLILLFGIGIAVAIETAGDQAREDSMRRAADTITARIDAQIAVLVGVSGLFRARPDVSRADVQRYLATVNPDQRAPGMLGVGFALVQRTDNGTAVRRALRANYGLARSPWPATDEPISAPIILLEPATAVNRRALGYDLYSEPIRRRAMQRAWETGEASATPPVTLIQDQGTQQLGFLVFVPLYAQGEWPGVSDDGRPPIIGFVYAPYRMAELVGALDGLGEYNYRLWAPAAADPAIGGQLQQVAARGGWMARPVSFDVPVVGQTWRIDVDDQAPNLISRASMLALIVAAVLALMVALLLQSQARRIDAVERLVGERAARAHDKDLMLREMSHRMKNILARVQAIARSSAREASSLDNFVREFGGRLSAMGNALTLLSAANDERVALRDLLETEFDGIGSDVAQRISLAGPALLLDEEQTQAMGLVVHELVTNSIKYGALHYDGRIAINWSVEADTGKAALFWREEGLAALPDVHRQGFGTRFVETLIGRQMRGSFSRYEDNGDYCIAMHFPFSRKSGPSDQPV